MKAVLSVHRELHIQSPFNTSLPSVALSKGRKGNEAPDSSASISAWWQLSLNNNLSQQILHQEINGPCSGLISL